MDEVAKHKLVNRPNGLVPYRPLLKTSFSENTAIPVWKQDSVDNHSRPYNHYKVR